MNVDIEDLSRYKRKALLITSLGTFMATLDSSIVNVSLPTISRELTTTINMVGWVILAYSIAIFSLLMFFGALSEKKGFQFAYRYGFLIFFAGSALCGFSTGITMLITSRVIQGIGAALLISVGPALITRSFPAEERGRSLSAIAMVVSVGLMLGPPLGGFIIGLAGWRWIFFVNLPVSLIGFYFTGRYLDDFPIADPNKKISFPGAASLSLGLLSLMMAVLFFSRHIVSNFYSIILALGSALFFGLFFFFENKPKTRLIGIDIFKNRLFTLSGTAMLLVFVSMISITILLPFYLEEIKGLQPEKVGLFLMIIPVCGFILAPLAGWLSDKYQARIVSSAGIIILGAGIYQVGNFIPDSTTFHIIVSLLLIGIGVAIFMTPNTSTLMGTVRRKQLGSAAGILATIRTLGIAMGAGLSLSIFSYFRGSYNGEASDSAASFIYGYQSVSYIMLIVAFGALLASMIRGNKNQTKNNQAHN